MELYKRQTRYVLRNTHPNICVADEPLTEWENNDSFCIDLEFVQELRKKCPPNWGMIISEVRFIPASEDEINYVIKKKE